MITEEGPRQEKKIEVNAEFEVGRPSGLAPGSPIDAVSAVNFALARLTSGRYEWQALIDDEVVDVIPFTVKS